MALHQIVDIDALLEKWAKVKFGEDFAVDKIDTSKVEVKQKAVSYQSSGEWWATVNVSEDFFDNSESRPVRWVYTETVPYSSSATWTLIKAFKSSRYLPMKIDLQYPVSQEGKVPLQVQFSVNSLDQVVKSDSLESTWRIKEELNVAPYSSSCACAQIRTCKLHNVVFATDVYLSGTIKVVGFKKGKKWTKQESSAGIVDALSGLEAVGFSVIENKSDAQAPARQVSFRFEGVCSGQVGVEAKVHATEITSLV